MNATYRRIPTEFGPETRFELNLAPALARREQAEKFELLKDQLVAERLETAWEPRAGAQVRGAANEAAALAWITPFPLLVFPVLFEEKVEAALARAERQAEVFNRTRELLTV